MGRPTMEGYWNSGKFLRYVPVSFEPFLGFGIGIGAYLCRVANLEEAGSSVEDCVIIVSRPSHIPQELKSTDWRFCHVCRLWGLTMR